MADLENLLDHLEHWAKETPSAVALTAKDVELTFSELAELALDTARRFRSQGVRTGDRVMLAGVNTPAWVVAFLGALRSGAVVVPVNSRLGAAQVPDLIDRVEPALILVDDSQKDVFDSEFITDDVPRFHLGGGSADVLDFFGSPDDNALPAVSADQPAMIAFTSGTTSTPKGAIISHRSVVAGARSWLSAAQSGPGARTTIMVPLFHNTAYIDQLAHMLVAGGSVDLVERYRTASAVSAMRRRPPTLLISVPSILRMLMLREEADAILGCCNTAAVGGSAMPREWILEASLRWPQMSVLHGYGLTEFTSLSHLLPIGDQDAIDSVGPPVEGVRCSIRDDDQNELAVGEWGEVWLAGPQRMEGYWRDVPATAKVFVDEWLRTGDIGSVDEREFLRLRGRKDDVINRGGEKIHPGIVLDALCSLPEVAEAVVVGVPDPLLGQRVCAAVVERAGRTFDLVTARDSLVDHLPDYALPEDVRVIEAMPVAPTGKVDLRIVTALFT